MYELARAIDDLMERARGLRVFGDAAGESECRGVEETPRGLVTPIVRRLLPLLSHVGDLLHTDDASAIHPHDRVIGDAAIDVRRLVLLERAVLRFPLQR